MEVMSVEHKGEDRFTRDSPEENEELLTRQFSNP